MRRSQGAALERFIIHGFLLERLVAVISVHSAELKYGVRVVGPVVPARRYR